MEEKIMDFRQLVVWERSHQLVLAIYRITKNFPQEEKYGLVAQMRRAAVSIPANIAEGFKRRGIKDKLNFYNISQASLEEVRYYLLLSKDLGYQTDIEYLWSLSDEVSKMLIGLVQSIKRKESKNK